MEGEPPLRSEKKPGAVPFFIPTHEVGGAGSAALGLLRMPPLDWVVEPLEVGAGKLPFDCGVRSPYTVIISSEEVPEGGGYISSVVGVDARGRRRNSSRPFREFTFCFCGRKRRRLRFFCFYLNNILFRDRPSSRISPPRGTCWNIGCRAPSAARCRSGSWHTFPRLPPRSARPPFNKCCYYPLSLATPRRTRPMDERPRLPSR